MKPGIFKSIAREIGALVEKKNAAYGDSVGSSGEALRLLYPKGIRPDQYADVLLQARIWDKQQRLATGAGNDGLGESPFLDIAGYGVIGVAQHQELHRNKQQEAAGDAAQVPAVGMQQRRKETGKQVLQHGVSPEAGSGRAPRETEYLRIEEVSDLPAQPHWSAGWKAGRSDQGVAEESVPAQEAVSGRAWHETTDVTHRSNAGNHLLDYLMALDEEGLL